MDVGGRATQDAKAEFTQEFVASQSRLHVLVFNCSIVSYMSFHLSNAVWWFLTIKKSLHII